MRRSIVEKLAILAEAARYDASCASSGSRRTNPGDGLGSASGVGICHTYTADGRCVSLLKLLLTNHCIYDCAYCVSRRSNDVPRVAFTVREVVELTLAFYRRNYVEGLFLSSGIFRDADTTTERLVRVARELRETHRFHGYIHLKVIPGASAELMAEAGRYADRLSVNLEIASEEGLRRVAPEKDHASALRPMALLRDRIAAHREEQRAAARRGRTTPPPFAPGGQSTQLVVGATPEDDRTVLRVADALYRTRQLRRIYYAAYVPVSADARVPRLAAPPLLREHRLYQADWLLRRYGFAVDEVAPPQAPMLDEAVDPKVAFALRHPHLYPVDANTAPYELLLRVPGVGLRAAQRIVAARRHGTLRWEHLVRLGVALRRARYFLAVPGHVTTLLERAPEAVRRRIAGPRAVRQLDLFGSPA